MRLCFLLHSTTPESQFEALNVYCGLFTFSIQWTLPKLTYKENLLPFYVILLLYTLDIFRKQKL